MSSSSSSSSSTDSTPSINQKSTIVLISGANQGIGYETAKKLSREHGDYHILMSGRNKEAIEKASGHLKQAGLSVEPIVMDVNSDDSIIAAAQFVDSKYHRLDVLINNAGINADLKFTNIRQAMQAVFETNLFGAAQVTEQFIPLLSKSTKTPRIVFISSGLGSLTLATSPEGRVFDYPAYRCSKAALNMLCVRYAVKYADKGWKINACCPGYSKTNLNDYQGTGTVEDGAIHPCRLATLGVDGESGTFSDRSGSLPW